jgi:hypothetical protein
MYHCPFHGHSQGPHPMGKASKFGENAKAI